MLLLASVLATGIAHSQSPAEEPPPFPGNQPTTGAEILSGGETSPDSPPTTNVAFKSQLAPYGEWVGHEGYGEVWVPKVDPTWRPYTNGRWANTDQGWGWVADEPWGWAPFHYGRWFYDRGVGGWAWVPGSDWAPAWVAWRQGGGYVGWAPLPPTAGFSTAAGLEINGAEISSSFFTFVPEGGILSPRINTVILPTARNTTVIHETIDITHYTVVNNHIINRGVSVQRIEQITGRRVPRLEVASMASEAGGRKGAFYQPSVLSRQVGGPHAEFGKALPIHAGTQQKSDFSAPPLAPPGAAGAHKPDADRERTSQLRAQQAKEQQARARQVQAAQQQKKSPPPAAKPKEKVKKPPA